MLFIPSPAAVLEKSCWNVFSWCSTNLAYTYSIVHTDYREPERVLLVLCDFQILIVPSSEHEARRPGSLGCHLTLLTSWPCAWQNNKQTVSLCLAVSRGVTYRQNWRFQWPTANFVIRSAWLLNRIWDFKFAPQSEKTNMHLNKLDFCLSNLTKKDCERTGNK